MRTRLRSEQLIKAEFPHLRYVRVHTHARNGATIYAWNDDLDLPEQEISSIKRFASEQLNPMMCFKVKAYHMVKTDRLPAEPELPEPLVRSALCSKLELDAILEVMKRLFPDGEVRFNRYDQLNGTVLFDYTASGPLHPADKDRVRAYLTEMVPIGVPCEVTFHQI